MLKSYKLIGEKNCPINKQVVHRSAEREVIFFGDCRLRIDSVKSSTVSAQVFRSFPV